MAAGVDQATRELLGQPGARSKADPNSEKVVLFLTDGQPTLPYGPGKDADNVRAVLEAADRAREHGIRVHTFAIGPAALAGPIATVELAARTQGYFIPVRELATVDVVEAVHFPDLHDVVVQRDDRRGGPPVPHRRGR
jgi:Mg-chelatase subunit ChlD